MKKQIKFILILITFLTFPLSSFAFNADSLLEKLYEDNGFSAQDRDKIKNLNQYIAIVGGYESGGKNIKVRNGVSLNSTAAGYYQMTETTLFGSGGLSGGVVGYIKRKFGIDITEGKEPYKLGVRGSANSNRPNYIQTFSEKEQRAITLAMWNSKGRISLKKLTEPGATKDKWLMYAYNHHGVRSSHRNQDLRATNGFRSYMEKKYGQVIDDSFLTEGGGSPGGGDDPEYTYSPEEFDGVSTSGEPIDPISVSQFEAGISASIDLDTKELLDQICAASRETANQGLLKYDGVCDQKSGIQGLFDTIQEVLSWLIKIAMVIAVFALFYTGFKFIAANGEPGKISDAKKTLVNVVIGLFFILSAFFIVDFVFDLLLIDPSYKFLNNVQ